MAAGDDELQALRDLARAAGVDTEYWDVKGRRHVASADTLVALLGAWGAPVADVGDAAAGWEWFHEQAAATAVEPVHVVRPGESLWVRLRLRQPPPDRAKATLLTEAGVGIDLGAVDLSGTEVVDHGGRSTHDTWFELGTEWPLGYHTLAIDLGDVAFESTVIVAPPAVRGFAPDDRWWGGFAPTYALRDRADLGGLEQLAGWLGSCGGRVVATLPLLATFLDEPYAPSPYTPVSRRFWNEAHIDLSDLAATESIDLRDLTDALAALDRPGPFDHRAQADLVQRALRRMAWPDAPVDDLPDLVAYARFRATAARYGTGWPDWPSRQHGGDIAPGDFDPDVALAHVAGQLVMRRQLLELNGRLETRGQRLYLDLPVGSHPEGFDTWFEPELFATDIATGAPPDDFFGEGQNWGFPPVSPRAGRAQAHAHFRACLQHHMEVAGILRLDHVMGLHRLFWVPSGMAATEGTYVRYPREELFAVLALESMRHDCIVVGEDLGTVPDEIHEAMARHELAGMYVAEFEMPSWPGAELGVPPQRAVASLDTHDTPTFAGFLRGLDIAQRVESELLDVADAHQEFEAREQLVTNLRGFLRARGVVAPPYDDFQLLVGALRFLGTSDAACVLVALEDLWGEVNPQNIPGTPAERPNWVQRFPYSIERMATEPRVVHALSALDESRGV
jgi:4-alpha-glucanotransferase